MKDQEGQVERAKTLVGLERYKEAEEILLQVLAGDPTNSDVLEQLSRICYNTKRLRDGIRYAKLAITADPESYYAHYLYAHGHQTRNTKLAYKHLESSLKIEPNFSNSLYLLAVLQVNDAKLKEALETISHGLRVSPNHSQLLGLRTRALTILGRKEEAAESAQAALRTNALDPGAHAEFAHFQLQVGDREESVARFREALRLDPNNTEAREGLMNALRAKNILFRLTLKASLLLQRIPARFRPLFGVVGIQIIRALATPTKGTVIETPVKFAIGALVIAIVTLLIFIPLLSDVLLAFTDEGRVLFAIYTHPLKPLIVASLVGTIVFGLLFFINSIFAFPFVMSILSLMIAPVGYRASDRKGALAISIICGSLLTFAAISLLTMVLV